MLPIFKEDLNWAVKRLPSDLVYQLKHVPGNFVIAGGYLRSIIRNEVVNDIDIFTDKKESAELLANKLSEKTKQYVTDNAISLTVQGKSVQIIHRWLFNSPEEIINHFDFTVVQAAIFLYDKSGKELHPDDNRFEWQGLVGDTFYQDLAAKRLVYTNPADAEPGSSLLRLLKYKGKGYNPTLTSLAQIVAKTAGVDSETLYDKFKEIDPASDPNSPVNKYSNKDELKTAADKPIISIEQSFV